MVTAEQLKKLHIGPEWVAPLNETFERFGIATPRQQAAFIGQCSHECANFRILEENLNYAAERLMKIWPSRFKTLEAAQPYHRNPKAIANKVYSGRMGNRDEASGDGWRFRGRGCIQLTGSDAYYHAGKALEVDLWAEPDLVATPQYAALTAGWFWSTRKCNPVAEVGDWTALTKKINGGTIGLQDRIKHIEHALSVLST
jgi:putative chitinase